MSAIAFTRCVSVHGDARAHGRVHVVRVEQQRAGDALVVVVVMAMVKKKKITLMPRMTMVVMMLINATFAALGSFQPSPPFLLR